MNEKNLLDGLNPQQREAAQILDGPLLIVAGAGSGKTRVLTYRIANLLAHGVSPWQILAITFTNKAALEMKERAAALIGEAASDVWLSTFHSFCAKILRREIEFIPGYGRNFVIYDSADSKNVIKRCLKEMNLDEKRFQPGAVQAAISGAKNHLMTPEKFKEAADGFFKKRVAEIYDAYQKMLKANNALDFDDLLMLTVRVLRESEPIREKYQHRFRYILVDEYQDTNGAQYEITKQLAAAHHNICVVGDADQSIYGWRGADISNIMDFEKDYPEARVVRLTQNYRSTKTIIAAANAVISHNAHRKPKDLWTGNAAGEPITDYMAEDERDEADFIARMAKHYSKEHGTSLGDMAVLYRTNAQSRAIEEGMMRAGLAYTMVGGLKFYDRKEIKDIVAYLHVVYNPLDSVSLMRIINVPKRGLGATSLARITEYAERNGLALFDVLSNPNVLARIQGITGRTMKPLEDFSMMIFDLVAEHGSMPVSHMIEKILADTGYMAALEAEEKPENISRIENLKEFIGVAKDFEKKNDPTDLEGFLETVSLVSDIDEADMEEDRITLMTFHSAKGLEFPLVFMAGMEDGIFPHSRTLMAPDEFEEERRTCYVGITRAKRKLFLTHAKRRMIYGDIQSFPPSQFIGEIPDECIEECSFSAGRRFSFDGNTKRPMYGRREPTRGENLPRAAGAATREGVTPGTRPPAAPGYQAAQKSVGTDKRCEVVRPDTSIVWKPGDRAVHGKWGTGTVVAVKGRGEEAEIQVAFPGVGVKALMQKYAPIKKV